MLRELYHPCMVGWRRTKRLLRHAGLIPELNFITIHYAYFILTGLICGLILWGSATPSRSLDFTDALFLAVSAMTEAGLNTVNLSSLNSFQQSVLFVLMMLGSAIFVSAFIVIVRLKAFEKEFAHIIRSRQQSGQNSTRQSSNNLPVAGSENDTPGLGGDPSTRADTFQLTVDGASSNEARQQRMAKKAKEETAGAVPSDTETEASVDLTSAERQELGGAEYEAVLLLSYLVPIYFVVWQVLSCISCGWWVAVHRPEVTRANGINPWWCGVFNAVSAFNNNGMSLLDANMTAFQDAYFLLITMGLLILAGNTAYPIFLRLIVWTMWKLVPQSMPAAKQTLRFLLDHPRRCYTNLFPSPHTWWLLGAIVMLNGIDWAAFEILNIGNRQITDLESGNEVIDGLFQALAVRSGGFYVVPIPAIRIDLQVLYVLMMYVSVYPVAISMRNSNIYEERSLGIFAPPDDDEDTEAIPGGRFNSFRNHLNKSTPRSFFVRQQVRAQLADDLIWIALAIFVIMIIEGGQFESNPVNFSVFNVIFEVVSAYATVGISVGVPNNAYSFCGAWHVLSKLVLIAVMIKGRHRGLPRAIDRAVQLPNRRNTQVEMPPPERAFSMISRSRTMPPPERAFSMMSRSRTGASRLSRG